MPDQIIALLTTTPMLRIAQIADKLDITVDDVDTLLRPHLIDGSVVEHEVTGPNGRPTMAYEVSVQGQRRHRPAVQWPEPAASRTPAPVPEPTSAPVPEPTRVDRAIACLTEHGSVATGQLRIAMGLSKTQSPVNFLSYPLRDGRIKREGEYWMLGPGKAAPEAKPDALETGAELGRFKPDLPMPTFVPVAAPAPQARADSTPSRCRFARWSDGQIEIKKQGLPSVELSREEFDELVRFAAGGA
jgi:hypothetical protein